MPSKTNNFGRIPMTYLLQYLRSYASVNGKIDCTDGGALYLTAYSFTQNHHLIAHNTRKSVIKHYSFRKYENQIIPKCLNEFIITAFLFSRHSTLLLSELHLLDDT